MKQVIVYTTKANTVLSYGDHITQRQITSMYQTSFQAGEFFDKTSIEEIHLPIQRFRWQDDKEIFAAFDEELLELIGCLQSQKDNEIAVSLEKRTKPLLQKIKQYESMAFWQRVKFVFTNKLED